MQERTRYLEPCSVPGTTLVLGTFLVLLLSPSPFVQAQVLPADEEVRGPEARILNGQVTLGPALTGYGPASPSSPPTSASTAPVVVLQAPPSAPPLPSALPAPSGAPAVDSSLTIVGRLSAQAARCGTRVIVETTCGPAQPQ